jgi:hypothetical protein
LARASSPEKSFALWLGGVARFVGNKLEGLLMELLRLFKALNKGQRHLNIERPAWRANLKDRGAEIAAAPWD